MSQCLRSLRKSWRGLCLRSVSMNLFCHLRHCVRSKSFGEGIWSRTHLRRMKRRTTKRRRRSRASLLISVHVSGAGSCSLTALARMDGSAHSHTMSLSSTQTHGSAMCWWLAGVWVQGQVKHTGGTGSGAWHPLTPSWVLPSRWKWTVYEMAIVVCQYHRS